MIIKQIKNKTALSIYILPVILLSIFSCTHNYKSSKHQTHKQQIDTTSSTNIPDSSSKENVDPRALSSNSLIVRLIKNAPADLFDDSSEKIWQESVNYLGEIKSKKHSYLIMTFMLDAGTPSEETTHILVFSPKEHYLGQYATNGILPSQIIGKGLLFDYEVGDFSKGIPPILSTDSFSFHFNPAKNIIKTGNKHLPFIAKLMDNCVEFTFGETIAGTCDEEVKYLGEISSANNKHYIIVTHLFDGGTACDEYTGVQVYSGNKKYLGEYPSEGLPNKITGSQLIFEDNEIVDFSKGIPSKINIDSTLSFKFYPAGE